MCFGAVLSRDASTMVQPREVANLWSGAEMVAEFSRLATGLATAAVVCIPPHATRAPELDRSTGHP